MVLILTILYFVVHELTQQYTICDTVEHFVSDKINVDRIVVIYSCHCINSIKTKCMMKVKLTSHLTLLLLHMHITETWL